MKFPKLKFSFLRVLLLLIVMLLWNVSPVWSHPRIGLIAQVPTSAPRTQNSHPQTPDSTPQATTKSSKQSSVKPESPTQPSPESPAATGAPEVSPTPSGYDMEAIQEFNQDVYRDRA